MMEYKLLVENFSTESVSTTRLTQQFFTAKALKLQIEIYNQFLKK